MACNKDEAMRAKELAEKKFAENDIYGAKRVALKAQKLYPEIDGLPQFLAALDVHISFGERINGVVDWYGVLGVGPLADDDTIRKHYRKLALVLHPDKNKSVGAEGAFQILSEAWSLLSDKTKRIAYDQKRYAQVSNVKSSSSVPAGENGFCNVSNNINLNVRDQRCATFAKHPSPHFRPKPNTFWTTCNACKMHFEYLRTYLNHNLLCPNCRQPFVAIETTPPPLNGGISSAPWASYVQQHNSSQTTVIENSYGLGRKPAPATKMSSASSSGVDVLKKAFQSGAFSNSGSASCAVAPSVLAGQAASGIQLSHGQLKRGREDAATAFMREEAFQVKTHDSKKGVFGLSTGSSSAGFSSVTKVDRPKKKRREDEHRLNNIEREMANQISSGIGGVGVPGSENGIFKTVKMKIAGIQKSNSSRELSQLDIRSMLMGKAKKEICRKLDEWSMESMLKTSHESRSIGKEIKEKKERQKDNVNGLETDAKACSELLDTKTGVQAEKSSLAKSDIEPGNKDMDPTSMSVLDPDFHDFDQDRTEKSFGENQVWAVYDDDDGMPRYYAMIHSVISLKPFKVRISWLNSKSNNELAPLNWVASGFPKTSGEFWRGKYEVNNSLNSFSHKVRWAKGTRGAIQIYPRKGDVWALYRNWSTNWNEHTPDEVIHKYDMVEVLEDYNEKTGITVMPLIKVPGLKTVFRQPLEQSKTRRIPREEMFRFSHQVPSYLLTGHEGHNAPKGCLELDPASTPLELLQVLTEAHLEEMESTGKGKEKYPSECVKNIEEEELVKNGKTKEKIIAEDVHKKVDTERKETREEKKMLVYKRRR
ncbi:hypothetical protein Pint_01190 [Pistacia integerrima]|uniref:Uncharacterized protein n=1 Tax=Pistacia integerrima TaxID=434235 RepID=A0ACC0ZJ44_9ROSI|nr:hypothetical protein Pint_01190 [Pistacia integerrima]